MKHSLTLLAFAAATVTLISAQPAIQRLDGSKITPAEIDATVTRLMRSAEVTGVGVTLFNQGNVVYQKAYGFRDTEKHLPLTVDSVLNAASFTKVAFAYMVMQLVDEKRLDLDRPVHQYLSKPLPEYPQYRDLAGDPRYQKITARMLLDHTSGFPNLRWLNDDHKLNINFQPGSRYAYSGEGMMLLQLVVETITGKPLEELMQERVFHPLGMNRTSMVWQTKFETDFANGYDEYGRSLGPDKRKQADSAGSMSTTLADFSRFMQAVMAGRGLSQKTREQMLSAQIEITSKHEFPTLVAETTNANRAIRLSYGLGWGLYQTPYGKAFFKEGHGNGFMNYTVCFDRQKTGIVIMTNSSNGEGIFKYLLETLMKNPFTPIEWEGYTPYDKLPPRPPLKQHKQVAIDPKLLDHYSGRYVFQPNVVLTIQREGDHLSVQENDEPKQELLPESSADFFSTVADDVYTFVSDKEGHVTAVVLHTGGENIEIKRSDSAR